MVKRIWAEKSNEGFYSDGRGHKIWQESDPLIKWIKERFVWEEGVRHCNDDSAPGAPRRGESHRYLKGITWRGREVELQGPTNIYYFDHFEALFNESSTEFALEVVRALLRAGFTRANLEWSEPNNVRDYLNSTCSQEDQRQAIDSDIDLETSCDLKKVEAFLLTAVKRKNRW